MSIEPLKKDMFEGKVASLREFLESGGDANVFDPEWNSPLIFTAVLAGNLEALQLLVEAGANVNLAADEPGRDILAETALSLAQQQHFLLESEQSGPIVDYLVKCGATDEI